MTNIDLTEVANYLLAQQQLSDMTEALDALLTPYEQQELVHRLQIFTLLAAGVSQREVAKQVGVGIATVTRGSKAFQAGKFHPEKLSNGTSL
ncbi:MAG: Trp family transcriptional regulator [Gammaproteobacteria bacterium]|jgi:TrpR family trp operon transcriptional repressor|nr:Trp family transcriptional regulator [Gammaproteobacteria bacterium]